MSSRKRGERNWEDVEGYPLHTQPPQKQIKKRRTRYSVTDQGNGWYDVTDGEYEWSVCRGADGVLTIEDTTYPNHRCDQAVIKAVENQ